MPSYTLPINQEGLQIKMTMLEDGSALNISGASVKQIKLWKPSGTLVVKTASFVTNGADGMLYAVLVSSDLDEAGWYTVRAYVEQGTFKGHSGKAQFLVENL